ncbi:MAG: lytic murein transglycosylase [Azospirillaceae bacterium]
MRRWGFLGLVAALAAAALPATARSGEAGFGAQVAQAADTGESAAGFAAWLDGVRAEAVASGLPAAAVDRALAPVTWRPVVVERDRNQPEFVRTFWDYVGRAVTDERVATGRERMAALSGTLARIEARYGVPGHYLVAIWGLESAFGRIQGDHPVIEALATRAYTRRETGAFRGQLLDALAIVAEGRVPESRLVGSWAGAMGQPQFMPSAYRAFAEDFDGTGFADIWASETDALASIANYLSANDWAPDERWGREVRVPAGFDWSLADLDIRRPLADWAAMGIRTAAGGPLPVVAGMEAALALPAGHQGPAYLVYGNFDSILSYNRALFYGLAIGLMADRLVERGAVPDAPPSADRPLTTDDIAEIQRLLATLGYEPGPADGIPGTRTKDAIRAFQQAAALPADGHHSPQLLDRLRTAAGRG